MLVLLFVREIRNPVSLFLRHFEIFGVFVQGVS